MSAGDQDLASTALDLPVHLIERLAQSKIVPVEAKLRALREWRAEVARGFSDSRACELMEWLYVAAIFVTHASLLQKSIAGRERAQSKVEGDVSAPGAASPAPTATGDLPAGR